ncbi:putative glutamate--cysteine ligase [Synechococcus sp. BS56D]|jgi:predicted glutamate--cysteine ligase|uniref:glutamate--cysteine ligase n=1 Tax=Synechococcus sp. BS56D TaxID=2055944 RepID=UPI0010393719|nr:glutamate--cysteine ligase [Synechococcus sp. BS56D]NDD44128.1 glutamate--cysteine ligase [Synechococcaceae bacterium WB9_4xB_025]TCD56002.1 putative glutamate--cysteine ligase [Synechococcus sp. BS56D]
MSHPLLLKGFEVELFTGRPDGENVGVAAQACRELEGFVTEPDQRNLEYVTAPEADYSSLREALISPRRRLRQWLAPRQLTLLPGSCLSLGDPSRFERTNPDNPYHDLIERSYGTRVVTASIHINLGIAAADDLFRALRLVRCEAALWLALSASSPFLGGAVTGAHSQRWLQFPLTPPQVPLFRDQTHYVQWMEEQLQAGSMHNVRHLWTSVRPNGPRRPHELNRLELRICDLISDPDLLLAVTTLLELRVIALLEGAEGLDPLQSSSLTLDQLADLCDANETAAARCSLDAELRHWQDGRPINGKDWVRLLLASVQPQAMRLGLSSRLAPIDKVLQDGNQAMRWLNAHASGTPIREVMRTAIAEMATEELPMSSDSGVLG